MTTTTPDAIERLVHPFADRAMRAFATALRSAAPGSPLYRAFAALSTDRVVEIALPVLRTALRDELDTLIEEARGSAAGLVATPAREAAIVAAVVAAAVAAVIAAGVSR